MKKVIYFLLFFVLVLLTVSVQLKNPQLVDINYYFGFTWKAPIMLLIFVSFLTGIVLGGLLMSVSVINNKRRTSKAKRQLAKAEKEVENLRVLPIKNEV